MILTIIIVITAFLGISIANYYYKQKQEEKENISQTVPDVLQEMITKSQKEDQQVEVPVKKKKKYYYHKKK